MLFCALRPNVVIDIAKYIYCSTNTLQRQRQFLIITKPHTDDLRSCSFDKCPPSSLHDRVTCFVCKLELHLECYGLKQEDLQNVGGDCNFQFVCESCIALYKPIYPTFINNAKEEVASIKQMLLAIPNAVKGREKPTDTDSEIKLLLNEIRMAILVRPIQQQTMAAMPVANIINTARGHKGPNVQTVPIVNQSLPNMSSAHVTAIQAINSSCNLLSSRLSCSHHRANKVSAPDIATADCGRVWNTCGFHVVRVGKRIR